MGKDFVIGYVAWKIIFGWFSSGIIFICLAFFMLIKYDVNFGIILLLNFMGVFCLLFGIWFTADYLKRDNYNEPQYGGYQEPNERRYSRQKPIISRIPKFCPECGVPTNRRKFCSNCGEKLF